jgi:flavodoxin
MKKLICTFIAFALFVSAAAFAEGEAKVLVVYYSRDGHTKIAAEEIASQAGAVTERIIDKKQRVGKLATMAAGNDAVFHKKTLIRPAVHDPRDFDIIIVGTPAWFSNMTPAVRTYLTEHGLSQKKVCFFATCHRVGADKAALQMAELVYGENAGQSPQLPLTHADLDSDGFKEKVKEFIQ